MLGGILDSIPGIGHVKGACHFLAGDYEGAKKSMYEASRSTAVLAGGAAGAVGGPAGMLAGAAGAGAGFDTVTSIVTGETRGVITGLADIGEDICNGNVPIGSVARTALTVGADMVGGMAGPSLGSCATKIISESGGKAMATTIVKQLTISQAEVVMQSSAAYVASRGLIDESKSFRHKISFDDGPSSCGTTFPSEPSKPSSSSSGQSGKSGQSQSSNGSGSSSGGQPSEPSKPSSSSSGQSGKSGQSQSSNANGSSSGGQPPQKNPNNNNNNNNNNKKDQKKKKILAKWEQLLLEIFEKEDLDEIIINECIIFTGLNDFQRKEFKDFFAIVKKSAHMDIKKILKIAKDLLSQFETEYVNSHNFLNIAKFILAYVSEKLKQRNDAYNESNNPDLSTDLNVRLQQLVQIILSESSVIIEVFQNLQNKITKLINKIDPTFVNVIAAVYHYIKHKFIAVKNILFEPDEYFKLAKDMMVKLKTLPEYREAVDSGETRIVYEIYNGDIGRRLVIVIKKQNGKWNLASVYYEDCKREGDEDGDEWINGKKILRKKP